MSLSYRNQSINLQSKWIDWFIYDTDIVDKVLRQKTLNEITAVFHSNFNYDYHFINEELEEQFERRFKSLGENIEK